MKQTVEAQKLREQQEAERIARAKKREKEEDKARKERILAKINAQKAERRAHQSK